MLGWAWEAYDANILRIEQPSKILCISWKHLGEEETHCKAICDYKGYKAGIIDDEKLVRDAWEILDNSDVICGQNSDKFDIKKLQARFLAYNLGAPSDYAKIDTLKEAKKSF